LLNNIIGRSGGIESVNMSVVADVFLKNPRLMPTRRFIISDLRIPPNLYLLFDNSM